MKIDEYGEALEREVMIDPILESFDLGVDEYVDLVSGAWAATPLNANQAKTALQSQFWHADPCSLSQISVAAFIYDYQAIHAGKEGPILTFEKLLSGFQSGVRGGVELYFAPGPIYLAGHNKKGSAIGTEMVIQEFYVPREMVGISINQTTPYVEISPRSLIGKVLHEEWNAVFASVTGENGQISNHAHQRLATALKIALGVDPQREDVRSQARELLRRQLQRFIVENLESPKLTVEMILSRFGVSRASLYRMFEVYGGIRHYITHLRASKAVLQVWQTQSQRGSVHAAQTRWGFASGNDFNRTVRRLFGNTPKRLVSSFVDRDDFAGHPSSIVQHFIDQRAGGKEPRAAVAV
ncbi:MAG: hypothetical protein AAFQ15_02720 [Pseudomonadota bacterium]